MKKVIISLIQMYGFGGALIALTMIIISIVSTLLTIVYFFLNTYENE